MKTNQPGGLRRTVGGALAATLVGDELVAAMLAVGASCGGNGAEKGDTPLIDPGDGGNYQPTIDPGRFVARIDNPYMPFKPGARWVYQSGDGKERIEVEVLAETRLVMGIAATVVRDRVSEDGELVEDTFDWYAQDVDGNVWYLGEDTREYDGGKVVSTHGAWEAGVDGAKPGIIMLAAPSAGRAYRQEFYEGEAEDMAEVVRLDDRQQVAFGSFEGVLVVREWTPLEPKVVEEKFYARGVGLVLEVKVAGESGRVELVSFEPGK